MLEEDHGLHCKDKREEERSGRETNDDAPLNPTRARAEGCGNNVRGGARGLKRTNGTDA